LPKFYLIKGDTDEKRQCFVAHSAVNEMK